MKTDLMDSSGLPTNALKLFLLYAEDAPNWNWTPLFNGNVCLLGEKEDRALLTWIKKTGLVTTFLSDGNSWIKFTDKGIALAAENGIEVRS